MTTLISSLKACNGRGARYKHPLHFLLSGGGGAVISSLTGQLCVLTSDSCAWVSVCTVHAVYVPCIFRVLYGQGCRHFYEESAVDLIIGRKMW
jgi:hypothetical protein